MRASITPDVSVAPLGSQNILQEPNRVYSFVQPAPVELEKDSSPKPNPAGDARLKAAIAVKAAVLAAVAGMEAVADAKSESAISVKKATASMRAAFTPDVSADPLGSQQNIALVPNSIYYFVRLQPPVDLEKDSPQPNPDGARLKAATALKAAVLATVAGMEAMADAKSEATISIKKTNASIRAAFTPDVSADPALISQNIVNEEPHTVSSLEPPVELESSWSSRAGVELESNCRAGETPCIRL
jgi:uncharacterized cupredoxin-like copper-binding protein